MTKPKNADTTLPARGGRGVKNTLLVFTESGVTQHDVTNVPQLTVGRSPGSTIVIDDPSLSREHLKLVLQPRPMITDLGSANGTRLGGVPLQAKVATPLTAGVLVEAGDVGLVWRVSVGADITPLDAPQMHDVMALVQRLARSTLTILIQGETGSGKEIMAETIHKLSPRANARLLVLNCAAFSESLLESELFGYERGAFTGAQNAKPGLLETAEGGTVLLDEIGDLSLVSQVKLLRVLEERKVWRAGALAPRPIDVRFLAATHKDLDVAVEKGTFRQDLFFRLNAITLRVPPLRKRVDEIQPLTETFIEDASKAMGRIDPPLLAPESLARLLTYDWPGNVRELRNVVGRAVALADDVILPEHLAFQRSTLPSERPPRFASRPPPPDAGERPRLKDEVSAVEKEHIAEALAACQGNRSKAARMLGIARNTLAARMARLDIDPKSRR
jgi:transcriptional regulator with PAS, ATPase and Fis domain